MRLGNPFNVLAYPEWVQYPKNKTSLSYKDYQQIPNYYFDKDNSESYNKLIQRRWY